MGRPVKFGIDYFNIDCVQEDNLNYIEALHGLIGYGIVVKLWRKIYMINGYYADFSEKHRIMFCRDIGVDHDLLMQVLDTCFKENMFSRDLFDQYQILTGSGVQKRWAKIVKEAKRNNCVIAEKYLISEFPPEKTEFPPEETIVNSGKSTQSKVKESKVKENTVAQAEPAPPKKLRKKKEAPLAEPHWKELVDCWFNFHKIQKLEQPSFDRADPRWLKILVQTLKKRSDKKNIDWTQENAVKALHSFLTTAFTDPWLQKHFTLKNLLDQFDPIVNRAKTNSLKPVPPQKPITESGPPPSNQPMELIRYYFGKFLENTLDPQKVDPFIYEILITRSMVPSGFCNPTPGEPMTEEQKKTAVIEFFKIQKAQNAKAS